MVKLGHKDQ